MVKNPYKLQLTNGFFAEFDQIARVLAYAVEHGTEGRVSRDAYASGIGVSASRAEHLCSIAVGFEVIQPVVLTATELGLMIHRYDPFLDKLGTLWLLHYLVSSNKRHVVWNRLVNRVIPENDRFSTAIARPHFDDLGQFYSERSMEKHLPKEIRVVWNAYAEQAFRHLGYVRPESEQIYMRGEPKPVPPHIFYAAVLLYGERFSAGSMTLDVCILAANAESPGRVFGLTERRVRDLLKDIESLGYLYVETRADLDQIRFRYDRDFIGVVRHYYEEH